MTSSTWIIFTILVCWTVWCVFARIMDYKERKLQAEKKDTP